MTIDIMILELKKLPQGRIRMMCFCGNTQMIPADNKEGNKAVQRAMRAEAV